MITPLSSIVHNDHSYINNNKASINDSVANNMPNGLLRIPSVQNNKDINHQVNNRLLKQIYTQKLAPSIGSLTENFVKAKSLFSPIYRSNEAVAKYEAVSLSPLKLTQVKKDLDRLI